MQRGCTMDFWFQAPGFIGSKPLEVQHAVGFGPRAELVKGLYLGPIRSHDELAAAAVGHMVGLAEGIQGPVPRHAKPRLQRAGRVVDPRMDDFAVPRTDARADAILRLQHHHLSAEPGQVPGQGEAHHTGPDDDTVHAIHGPIFAALASLWEDRRFRSVRTPGSPCPLR